MAPDPLPKPIRILSDLHLGHDACALGDVREIRPLLEGARSVIFNGDTAEVRSDRFRGRAAEEQAKLTTMLSELGVEQSIYLTGNHDPRISEKHALDLCQDQILVTHGDFLFRHISPWSKKLRHCRPQIDAVLAQANAERLQSDFAYRLEVTRACCDVLEMTNTPSPKNLLGLLHYIGQEVWPPTRLFTIFNVWLKSPGLMSAALERYRPESKAVVFGHIHYPKVWRRNGRLLVNTGGFLNMVKANLVELNDDELRVIRVQKRQGECRLAPTTTASLALRS